MKLLLSQNCGTDFHVIPAPVIQNVVVRRYAGSEARETIDAILDTAASMTAIPKSTCITLQLPVAEIDVPVQGHNRTQKPVLANEYWAEIEMEGLGRFKHRVLGTDRPNILLGRNFLLGVYYDRQFRRMVSLDTPLRMTLNGQSRSWRLTRPQSWWWRLFH